MEYVELSLFDMEKMASNFQIPFYRVGILNVELTENNIHVDSMNTKNPQQDINIIGDFGNNIITITIINYSKRINDILTYHNMFQKFESNIIIRENDMSQISIKCYSSDFNLFCKFFTIINIDYILLISLCKQYKKELINIGLGESYKIDLKQYEIDLLSKYKSKMMPNNKFIIFEKEQEFQDKFIIRLDVSDFLINAYLSIVYKYKHDEFTIPNFKPLF